MVLMLALRNVVKHKRTYFPVFFCLFFVVGLSVSILYYSDTICYNIKKQLVSEKKCTINICSNSNELSSLRNALIEIKANSFISDIISGCQMPANEVLLLDNYYKKLDITPVSDFLDSYFVIDGIKYCLENSQKYTQAMGVEICYIDYSIMYDNNLIKNNIIVGDTINSTNQIVIPEQYLKMLGFCEYDYENLIGKRISVYISSYPDYNSLLLLENYTIVGILSENYYTNSYLLSLIVSIDDLKKKEGIYTVYTDVCVEKYDYEKCKEIVDAINKFGLNDVSFSDPYDKIDYLYKQYYFINNIIIIVSFYIFTAVILYLIIFLVFSMNQSIQMSYTYISLGIEPNKIVAMRVLENAIVAIIASIIAIPLFCLVSHQTLLYINSHYEFAKFIVLKVIMISLLILCIFSVMSYFVISIIIKTMSIRSRY